MSTVLADGLTWPLNCDLYVRQAWIADSDRCSRARILETTRFRPKWRIALSQVRRAIQAGVGLAAVVADADHRPTAAFRRGLERFGVRYAFAIRGFVTVWIARARRLLPISGVATAAARVVVEAYRIGDRHQRYLGGALRGPPRAAGQESRRAVDALPAQPRDELGLLRRSGEYVARESTDVPGFGLKGVMAQVNTYRVEADPCRRTTSTIY